MAGNDLATLTVKLVADTSNYQKEIKATEDKSNAFAKNFGKVNDAFEAVTGVSMTAAGAIAALGGGLKFVMDQGFESARSMAATEAVIKSTGGAAGMTAEEVAGLAKAESGLTSIDDDVIQGGENMLLTFKNIGEDTFPRATRATEDMAVAMAQGDTSSINLKDTAIQLGKALNDPIAGISALSRVGVTFTNDQKRTIKSMMDMNDIAGAQGIILNELESEFGGMAEAMGSTDEGKINKAKLAIENLGAAVGEKLIPVLGDAAETFTILVTASDKIAAAHEQQAKDVVATSATYVDYAKAVMDSYVRTGELAQVTEDWILSDMKAGQVSEEVAQKYGFLTEGMFNAIKAAQDESNAVKDMGERLRGAAEDTGVLEKSQEALKSEMSELKLFMDGPLGESNKKFADDQSDLKQKAADLTTQIGELEAKPYLTTEQKDNLTALKGDLDEVNGKIVQSGEDHEAATNKILFGILQQQLAMDGLLDTADVALLQGVAKDWGLVDSDTYAAYLKMEDYRRILQNAGADAETIRAAIARIPSEKNVIIKYQEQYGEGIHGRTPTEYAAGGRPPVGVPSLVGERGPELFVPDTSGYILPNSTTSKIMNNYDQARNITNNWNIYPNYAGASPANLNDDIRALAMLHGGVR